MFATIRLCEFFSLSGKCVYQRGRDVPWSSCSGGKVTRTKELTLAKVKGRSITAADCPKKKVLAKVCHNKEAEENKGTILITMVGRTVVPIGEKKE